MVATHLRYFAVFQHNDVVNLRQKSDAVGDQETRLQSRDFNGYLPRKTEVNLAEEDRRKQYLPWSSGAPWDQ